MEKRPLTPSELQPTRAGEAVKKIPENLGGLWKNMYLCTLIAQQQTKQHHIINNLNKNAYENFD